MRAVIGCSKNREGGSEKASEGRGGREKKERKSMGVRERWEGEQRRKRGKEKKIEEGYTLFLSL